MGIGRGMEWANSYGKERCRRLFWRIRAAMKKAIKNGSKQKLSFHYDPCSYALNFDEGVHRRGDPPQDAAVQAPNGETGATSWVYVLWVKPSNAVQAC